MSSKTESGIFETLPLIRPEDAWEQHEDQHRIVTGIVNAISDPEFEKTRIRYRTSLPEQDTGEKHD